MSIRSEHFNLLCGSNPDTTPSSEYSLASKYNGPAFAVGKNDVLWLRDTLADIMGIVGRRYEDLSVIMVLGASKSKERRDVALQDMKLLENEITRIAPADKAKRVIGNIHAVHKSVCSEGSMARLEAIKIAGSRYFIIGLDLDHTAGLGGMTGRPHLDGLYLLLHELAHVVHFGYHDCYNASAVEVFGDAFAAHFMKIGYGVTDSFELIEAARRAEWQEGSNYRFHLHAKGAQRVSEKNNDLSRIDDFSERMVNFMGREPVLHYRPFF